MARTELQQATALITGAKHILITFPMGKANEAAGSALALATNLEKLGKRADIACSGFSLPGGLRFLPQAKRIAAELTSLRKFIVNVNLEHAKLKDFSYSVEGNKLVIYLTPQSGSFTASDLSTRSSDFAYDLILTLDTPDLDSLGELYHNNTEFFFATSILNLDHLPTNEHFGQVNLIDLNVAATAELAYELLRELKPILMDADTATCLYAALTVATKSFTTTSVTPATLSLAAELVNLGARREEVVTHLYRTKQLPTLKLWGRALARLKSDSPRKLVWSLLQPDDFVKAGADESELAAVVDELISTAPEAGTVVLLYEVRPSTTAIFLTARAGLSALDLLKPFDPAGDRKTAWARLPGKGVLEAEQVILTHLRQVIKPLEA